MDKELLFKPALPEAEVDIPGKGSVRVRALSRYEVMLLQKSASEDKELFERKALAMALVDPAMSEADVERWMRVTPFGDLNLVTMKISELSGLLDQNAVKEAIKTFREES